MTQYCISAKYIFSVKISFNPILVRKANNSANNERNHFKDAVIVEVIKEQPAQQTHQLLLFIDIPVHAVQANVVLPENVRIVAPIHELQALDLEPGLQAPSMAMDGSRWVEYDPPLSLLAAAAAAPWGEGVPALRQRGSHAVEWEPIARQTEERAERVGESSVS